MHKNNLTILIVAYKPKSIFLKSLILQFNNSYPIYIVNNSEEKLENFFYELKNTKIIESKSNLGNGAGINLALEHCQTDFALYMDIDIKFDEKNLKKLMNYSEKIKKFGVLVPNGMNKNITSKIEKKWDIEGSIMLINKKFINNRVKFDENYFLYFEENDYFFNCLKKGINVFFIPKVKFQHYRASSIDEKKLSSYEKIYLLRQWHYMWSNFYFFKKNFNLFMALKEIIPFFFKDVIMLIINIIKFNSHNIKIRYARICGLLNSLLNLKSSKRL
jgi:GT2 family glycosyltransferase